jgi:hypothetical protein
VVQYNIWTMSKVVIYWSNNCYNDEEVAGNCPN